MKLTLSVDTTKGRRRLELMGLALSDVRPVLGQFGKTQLIPAQKKRFAAEGPGWAPLAQSTGHRLIHTFTGRVTARGTVRRTARLKQLEQSLPLGVNVAIARATRATGGGALGEAFRRHLQGSKKGREVKNIVGELDRASAGKPKKQKRAIAKHRLLGGLATTIVMALQKKEVSVGSRVAWAGAQNEGDVVGHGAHVPARPFAYLESEDGDVLGQMIVDRAVKMAGE